MLIASIRGGALIDDVAAAAHWRLAPVRGASLLKTMMRTRIAGDREAGRDTSMAELEAKAANEPVRLAGNILSPAMIAELRDAEPAAYSSLPQRVARHRRGCPARPSVVVAGRAGRGCGARGGDRRRHHKVDDVMRDHLSFACEGDTIAATIDRPEGAPRAALLIVSGGNELRSGAHRGMAMLAQRLAAQGMAILRFDRRGVGDSTGDNRGFDASGPDIAAALAQLRAACPPGTPIAAFGNCDAASALALHGPFAGIDALVLANPWVIEDVTPAKDDGDDTPLPSAAAIRARYRAKLKDPREWLRLLRGGVDLAKLARGLLRARSGDAPSPLAARLGDAMARCAEPTHVLLASRDRTAIEFEAAWISPAFAAARENAMVSLHRLDSASHSFAREDDATWLEERLIETLTRSR